MFPATSRSRLIYALAAATDKTHRNTRNRGVARKFVSEGDKRVGSVTSGVHTGTEPTVGSGAKPPKHEKYAENLTECHKFHIVRRKFFSLAISEGDMSPLVPLPYTADLD